LTVSKNTKTQLIEIILPKGRGNDIRELLYEHPLENYWRDTLDDNQTRIRILLQVGVVEPVLDILDRYLKELPEAKAILFPVEAVVPRPESKEPETESEQDQDDGKVNQKKWIKNSSITAAKQDTCLTTIPFFSKLFNLPGACSRLIGNPVRIGSGPATVISCFRSCHCRK
jgi:hypothetical protein